MGKKTKFACRKWHLAYGYGSTYLNELRLPYFNPASIGLYAYGESCLTAAYNLHLSKPYFCLEYTLEGEYSIQEGEDIFHLKKGDLFLGRPYCKYERMVPKGTFLRKLEIDLNNSPLVSLLCNHVSRAGNEIVRNCPPLVEETFHAVGELVRTPMDEEEYFKKLSSLIFSLFTELQIHAAKENLRNSFDDLLGKLDLFSHDLTIKQMAEHFQVGERSLYRLFQKHLNCSPVQYLIYARMKYAGQLLNSHTLNIREIAEECGYRNVSFFCSEFKKYTGMTPLAFRKTHTLHEEASLNALSGWDG